MPGRAGPGAALAWTAAGLLCGWLLLRVQDAATPGFGALIVSRPVAEWVGGFFQSIEAARAAVRTLGVVVNALPGGLVLGALVGVAMSRIATPRLLGYSTLAWPAGTLAASQYRFATLSSAPSDVQFYAWLARNYVFVDTAIACAVFFVFTYAAFRLGRMLKSRSTCEP